MKMKGKVYFHSIVSPDTQYDPAWKITLVVTKAERDKVLKECKLTFKRIEDMAEGKTKEILEQGGEFSINFSRKTIKKGKGGGKPNSPPKLYVNGELKSPSDMPDFQWGSLGEVEFTTYNWEYKGSKGVSADFQSLNMLEILEYVAPEEGESSDEAVDGEDTPEEKW